MSGLPARGQPAGPVRAFVAIEIPEPLRQKLWSGTAPARVLYPEGKWVVPGNLHLTVKFLGNVEAATLPAAGALLDEVCLRRSPYSIKLAGAGTFPGGPRARVIWAGIADGQEETGLLAAEVDSALGRLGFAPEGRPFRAHLTIARAGRTAVPGALLQALDGLRQAEWGSFAVQGIVLMQSILRPQGPLYRPISHHGLGAARVQER